METLCPNFMREARCQDSELMKVCLVPFLSLHLKSYLSYSVMLAGTCELFNFMYGMNVHACMEGVCLCVSVGVHVCVSCVYFQ